MINREQGGLPFKKWADMFSAFRTGAGLRHYLLLLVIIFPVLSLMSLLLPIYFETGNDIHCKVVVTGVFTGYPEGLVSSYGCFVLLSDLYAWLYRILPGIPWFDLSQIFFLTVILLNAIYIILPRNIINSRPSLLLAITILLYLSLNILQVEVTRTSILLAGSSMVLLQHPLYYKNVKFRWWLYAMILSGLLLRVEGGVLALVLVSAVYLLRSPLKKSWILSYYPVGLLIILTTVFINFPRNEQEKQYMAIRPYQFSLWDFYRGDTNVVLNSAIDSVKYFTATKSFLADDEMLTPAFFNEIGVKKADKTPRHFMAYFHHFSLKWERLKSQSIFYYKHHPLFLLTTLTLVLLILIFRAEKKKVLLSLLLSFVFVLLIAFFMKLEWRLLFPLISLGMLMAWSLSGAKSEYNSSHFSAYVLVIGTLIVGVFVVYETTSYQSDKSKQNTLAIQSREAVRDIPGGAVVLVNKQPYIFWYKRLFQRVGSNKDHLFVILDNGLLFIQKSQKMFLDNNFGCHYMSCYLPEIMRNSQVYFLSDPARMELMTTYVRYVHGVDINFEVFRSIEPYGPGDSNNIYVYEVKK